MRKVILDTETTGLDVELGHKIIEIGCIEIVNREITTNFFHKYINPKRSVDKGALGVHGLTEDFLSDKQEFREIANDFVSFIQGSELIIHNARFDIQFLNAELFSADFKNIESYCEKITDSLLMAKEINPGKRNNLDALCSRYKVNNSKRDLHGALLDARLLSEVYLSMTRGQDTLQIDNFETSNYENIAETEDLIDSTITLVKANKFEILQHEKYLKDLESELGKKTIWNRDSQND